jgi:hypothetical protein
VLKAYFEALPVTFAWPLNPQGQLVAVSPDGKKVKNSPVKFGCYLLSKDRTDRGLAKDRLRSFWEDS